MGIIGNQTAPSTRLFSESEESQVREALTTLHMLVANDWPNGKPLGDKVLVAETIKAVSDRIVRGLQATATERKREAEKQIREDLADLMAPFADRYESAKDAYNSLPSEAREYMGGFSSSYNVPCAALSEAFPSGATVEQVAQRCKELGFTVVRLTDAGKTLAIKVSPKASQ
jgi:hypothetical protein